MVPVAARAVEPQRGLVVALNAGDELSHASIGRPSLGSLRQCRTQAAATSLLCNDEVQVSAEKRLQDLVRRWLRIQRDLVSQVGKAKREMPLMTVNEEILEVAYQVAGDRIQQRDQPPQALCTASVHQEKQTEPMNRGWVNSCWPKWVSF